MADTYASMRPKSTGFLVDRLNEENPIDVDILDDDPLNRFIIRNGYAEESPAYAWKSNTLTDFKDKDVFKFDNIDLNNGNKEAFRYASAWKPEHEFGLFLFGPPGTGKTHLLKALMRRNVSSQYKIWFVETKNLVSEIFSPNNPMSDEKSSEQRTRAILEKYTQPFGLILDDIQQLKSSDYQNDILKTLLDSRRRKDKRTFMTCDLTKEEIQGHFHRRVLDRISGLCEPLRVEDVSHRKLKREKTVQKFKSEIFQKSLEELAKEDTKEVLKNDNAYH